MLNDTAIHGSLFQSHGASLAVRDHHIFLYLIAIFYKTVRT